MTNNIIKDFKKISSSDRKHVPLQTFICQFVQVDHDDNIYFILEKLEKILIKKILKS